MSHRITNGYRVEGLETSLRFTLGSSPVLKALALLAIGLSLAPPAAAQVEEPNLVFILADDLGWTDLALYGSDLHRTPHLDRFAQSGVRFTNAYTTSPVCSPTRASILTGKHPARLHMTVWREAAHHPPTNRKLLPPRTRDHLPLEETTLAEIFKQAGYVTAHVGKWHLGRAEQYPQNQGFDYNVGGTLWGAPQTFFYPYSGDRYFREPRYVPGLTDGKPGEYLTDRLTDEAVEILERHQDDPFYLNLWFHTVHTPIEAPPEMAGRYAAKIHPGLQHQNAHYAAMVESLDRSVGRILAKLDELELSENTIVVFASDNGGFVNEWQGKRVTDNSPLRSGKGSLYEGGIRTPLIIRVPGITPGGAVIEEAVSSVDFFPTLLSVAGLDAPEGYVSDGADLSSILRDPTAGIDRETLYFHYPHYYPTTSPVSAIRRGEWKLLRYYEDQRTELYNLEEDLEESRDLAAQESSLARELKEQLEAWLEEVDAQHPTVRETGTR